MPDFFDVDTLSGAVETFDYDESTDTAIILRSADVEPIIERNKTLLSHGGRGPRVAGEPEMIHVASIPIDVSYLWLQRFGVRAWDKNHWPEVKRLLNSNEWRYLRVREIYL